MLCLALRKHQDCSPSGESPQQVAGGIRDTFSPQADNLQPAASLQPKPVSFQIWPLPIPTACLCLSCMARVFCGHPLWALLSPQPSRASGTFRIKTSRGVGLDSGVHPGPLSSTHKRCWTCPPPPDQDFHFGPGHQSCPSDPNRNCDPQMQKLRLRDSKTLAPGHPTADRPAGLEGR